MRVAITGGRGFTGRFVVPSLAQRGHQPIPLRADITDAGAVAAEIAAVQPEALLHLAAKAFVQSDDLNEFYDVNQIGAFNVLQALVDHVPGIPVVLASTAQVYGPQAAGLIDETAGIKPWNHYALSKAGMEMGAAFLARSLRITITRPFNYTGVGQEDRYLIPKIVSHFARRAPVIELGNLDVWRDFGDVRAVAEAYATLVDAEPGLYNICTGRLHSVREVLGMLQDMTGHKPEIRVNPAFVRADDVKELGGDPRRLQAALPAWSPISFEDTLAWMLGASGAG